MKKKLVGICVCMLVITTALPIISAVSVNEKDTTISSFGTNGIEWSKTYGGSKFDEFRWVRQTADGGYIAAGETTVSGNLYPWVLKVDAAGFEEWSWTLTQFNYNQVEYAITNSHVLDIQQINGGGYVVALNQLYFIQNGKTLSFGGLAKLNAAGVQEWVKVYADAFVWTFKPAALIVENDGYLLVGFGGSPETTATDTTGTMLKTDLNGVEQWHKNYQFGAGFDCLYAVCHTTDNGYLTTGDVTNTSNYSNYWMIKTDANGNEQWNKTFRRSASWSLFSNGGNCYQTPDGGYIMGGYSYLSSSDMDSWIVKTDSSGEMDWNKTIGMNTKRDAMFSFEQTNDAGYVICDTSNFSSIGGNKEDVFLIKIDENANTEWVQMYGGPGTQIGLYVNSTRDGGFIVAGRTGENGAADSDGFLVKFASFTNQRPSKPTISGPSKGKPDTNYTFTASSTDPDGGPVSYRWDWGDGNYSKWLSTTTATYAWSYEANFEVRVMAKDVHGGESDWSDPLPFSTPLSYDKPVPQFLELLFQRFPHIFPL